MTGVAGNNERFAFAALTWIGEPGDVRLGALARVNGPVMALELIKAGRVPQPGEPTAAPKARRTMGRWRAAAGRVPGRAEIAAAFHCGLRLICPGDAEWSAGLDALGETAPLALWARGSGDLAGECAQSVAVPGRGPAAPSGARPPRPSPRPSAGGCGR
jgi:DNA processing protein